MELKDFEPIFGEARAECSPPASLPLHPLLFHVHAPDSSRLRVHVTDFRSSTWEAVRSVQQLDDMRDSIGIGGTWDEFVDYVISSITADDVKVVLEGNIEVEGYVRAKLVAQKSKGMPLIIFSLTKLVNSAACEAMANVSMNLFKAFRNTKALLAQEQTRSYQLTKEVSDEQEKRQSIENQMEMFSNRRKLVKIGSFDKTSVAADLGTDAISIAALQNLQDKLVDVNSTKATNRVVPTRRRAKVRGALLHDTEEDKGK